MRVRLLLVVVLSALLAGAVLGWREWRRVRRQRLFDDAWTAIEKRDWQRVEIGVESLRRLGGSEPQWRVLHSAHSMSKGDYSTARKDLSMVKSEGPLSPYVLLLNGQLLLGEGRELDAERVFSVAARDWPDLAGPHRALAAIYRSRGAMVAASDQLQQVIRLVPNDYLAFRQLALLCHRDLADNRGAIENYRLSLERNPPDAERPEIVKEFAEALIMRGDYREALEALESVEIDAVTLTLKADCCRGLDRRRDGWDLVLQARKLDPQERRAMILEGRMHMEDGAPEKAIEPLEQALAFDPHDFSCRYRLVRALQQSGQTKRAEEELAKKQESERLRFELTRLYTRAVENPDNAILRYEIADLCDRLGQRDLAVWWRNAAETTRRANALSPGRVPGDTRITR